MRNTRRGAGASAGSAQRREPAFEMIVLGSGGGPLETDLSGYIVKPVADDWKQGFLAVEGGSGLGALVNILQKPAANTTLFPTYAFPSTHTSPLLQAAHIFSHLAAYILTHAHLDHAMSLAIASGSLPSQPDENDDDEMERQQRADSPPGRKLRTPVFGAKSTLEKLQGIYNGDLWPELGKWSEEEDAPPTPPVTSLPDGPGKRKRKRQSTPVLDPPEILPGAGVQFCPISPGPSYTTLLPSRSLSASPYPVAHGCTSHGVYESSAFFIRSQDDEFLFWGDTESALNDSGVEGLNEVIWKNAAQKFKDGRLRAVFIECSYTSSRPASRMYGHLSPPSLFHELGMLAAFVDDNATKPLDGLRVFITHVKDSLYPHSSGKTVKERVKEELDQLEEARQLGVVFELVHQGQRLLF